MHHLGRQISYIYRHDDLAASVFEELQGGVELITP